MTSFLFTWGKLTSVLLELEKNVNKGAVVKTFYQTTQTDKSMFISNWHDTIVYEKIRSMFGTSASFKFLI